MKKILALILALTMVLALAACGSSAPASTPAPSATPAPEASEAPAEAEAPAEEPAEAPAEEAAEAPAAEEAAAEEAPGFTGSYLMGTGSATGNYYAFGNAVCTVVNNVTGANLTVNATGGSTENARLLGSKENEFAMIQSDVYSYAHQGVELFDGSPITNF